MQDVDYRISFSIESEREKVNYWSHTGKFSIKLSLDLYSLYTKMASHEISGLSNIILQVNIRP